MLSILTTLGLRLPATLVVGNAARPAVLTTIRTLLSKLPYLGSLPDVVISSSKFENWFYYFYEANPTSY
jgi:hypothetical protein